MGEIYQASPASDFTVKIGRIPDTAATVILSDAVLVGNSGLPSTTGPALSTRYDAYGPSEAGLQGPGYQWHPGRVANFLMVDGHVEPLTGAKAEARFADNTLFWYRPAAQGGPYW